MIAKCIQSTLEWLGKCQSRDERRLASKPPKGPQKSHKSLLSVPHKSANALKNMKIACVPHLHIRKYIAFLIDWDQTQAFRLSLSNNKFCCELIGIKHQVIKVTGAPHPHIKQDVF